MSSTADAGLSAAEIRQLGDIAGTMIPDSVEHGVPGAGDPAILEDIVTSIGRDLRLVRESLAAIASRSDGAFAGLDLERREAVIDAFYRTGGAAATALGRVILAAYYRDDRVLKSLKLEARPPFPKGYTLEQGDWSLLDPVRQRPPLWRDDRNAGKR